MTRPALTFLGAAGTVTGSRFLVESGESRLLVDAGLNQGPADLRRRNWEDFPVSPRTIDAVILSHAHLDHCGFLPRLVRDGFRGRIVSTIETAQLAAVVLRDSAHLQQEDAAYANEVGFSKHRPALPLYDADDVEKTLPLWTPIDYHERLVVAPGLVMTLQPAGHILGSASVLVDAAGRTVLFSGDLGRPQHPLLLPPDDPPDTETVVVESTYGDRSHPVPDDSVLADTVTRTINRGGSVLIPAFAVDRTELVLLALRRLRESGRIPPVPIFVDSPMALAGLRVYQHAAGRAGSHMRPTAPGDPFNPGDLRIVRDAAQSERLNRPSAPCIIISASGMATGGRVVHHLRHQLPDRRNTVILTGYQAIGTRGRQLLEGARQVKMHGRYVPVNAEIIKLKGFSAHADAEEIVGWLSRAPHPPRIVYVVHGEPQSSSRLAERIVADIGCCAIVPRLGERVLLD